MIKNQKLAAPYLVWMVLFTVVPLLIVVYYALTDGGGRFTLENLTLIGGYSSVFARSLLLAMEATVICLVIAFPVGYALSRMRVAMVPPMPAYYNHPQTIDDVTHHVVTRVLDQFGLEYRKARRWNGLRAEKYSQEDA